MQAMSVLNATESSLDLIEEANQNKSGANAGKYSIRFCNVTKAGLKPRPRFHKYQNAFHLLEWDHQPQMRKAAES